MSMTRFTAAAAAGIVMGSAVAVAGAGSLAPGHAMYGINRDTGDLHRHRFDAGETDLVHPVRLTSGKVLTGIDASTYIPGFQNLMAFWTDPDDGQLYLVYVNAQNVPLPGLPSAVLAAKMEGGRITGATRAHNGERYEVFVVQDEQSQPFDVEGSLRINPNNDPAMRFYLQKSDGSWVTRDDLLEWAKNNTGEKYTGEATYIRVRPAGPGSQNTLKADGEEMTVQNNNTYIFEAAPGETITVHSLWNEHDEEEGAAMGKWFIKFEGKAAVNGEMAVSTPRRLARVDHRDGTVIELAQLTQTYDALATVDGQTFYATRDKELFQITHDGSELADEHLLGEMHPNNVLGLDFAGDRLLGFTVSSNRLYSFDLLDPGHSPHGHASDLGMSDLGTITIVPEYDDQGQFPALSYD